MKKYIKWILLGVIIVIGIFLVKLPTLVQNVAVKRLEKTLGRKVSSGEIKYNYLRNILYMNNFKIFEEDGSSVFVAFESLNVNINITSLLKKTFYVKELTFVKPNINIIHIGDVPNYQSILNRLEESKKEDVQLKETDDSQGFIKSYELKNIVIDSFNLFYEDKVITASNNFTFETPSLTYTNGIFKLDSTVDFYETGVLNFDLEYADNGSFKVDLVATDLLLDDKLYITKILYNLDTVKGTLNTALKITGNTKENDYSAIGNLSLHRFLIDSEKQGELLKVKNIDLGLDLSIKENRYYFKGIESSQGMIDTEKIIAYLNDLPNKNTDSSNDKKLDVNIDNAKIDDFNIFTEFGQFSNTNILLNNFTGKKEDNTDLDLSFTYNDKTKVKLNSSNILLDGLNLTKNTITSKGQLLLEGQDLTFIDKFLPKDAEYDIKGENITYKGSYNYSYPKVQLKNNVSLDRLSLIDMTADYKNISTKTISTNNTANYNLKDNDFDIIGTLDITKLDVTNYSDETIISADKAYSNINKISSKDDNIEAIASLDITKLTLKDLTNEMIISVDNITSNIENLNLKDNTYKVIGDLDISKLAVTNPANEMIISANNASTKMNGISANNFNLGYLNLKNLNIDLTKLPSSDNNAPDNSTKAEFPVIVINSLTISNSSLIDKNYNLGINLNGSNISTLKGNSQINFIGSYNNSPLTIKGRVRRGRDLKTTSQLDFITFNGNSNINNFDISELNIYTDNQYDLKGKVNLNSEIRYAKDNISTINKVDAKDVSFKLDKDNISIKTLTSDNSFDLKGNSYLLNGNLIYNNSSIISDSMKLNLKKGELQIDKITPKDIILESITLSTPLIKLLDSEPSTSTPKEKEQDIDKLVENKEREPEKKAHILVKKFLVEDGRIDYTSKDLKYNIKNIDVKVNNFTTKQEENFDIKAHGDLTGAGKVDGEFVSSLEKDWDFKPTSLNLDGNFKITNLNLLDFNDYLETRLPNEIDSGKFNYTGDIKLKNGSFQGDNVFVINTIYIGERTSVESHVPLKLAVGILKDRKGNLKLDVPVSGDFNDPKFRLSRVILQAIKNILIKTVTSPVDVLAKAFHLGSDEILALDYEYLQVEPKLGDATLNKIADILNEKRNITMIFTLFTNTDEEKRILNDNIKEDQIFKRNTKDEKLEEKLNDLLLERKTYIEQYFNRALLSKRVRVEVSDIPRDTPTASIDIVINQ